MPRLARIKSNGSIYHVMCKSISEIKLLKDESDKLKYISLLKDSKMKHQFKIYSYCFMDNHLHLIVDTNGADISQIMHGINFTYATYFNKKYKRHGHLFQDRFKSKVIATDDYLIRASAYIHNNATDIKGYKKCPEKYRFSSLAVYLGLKNDPFELVETNFILSLFGENLKQARERYYELVFKCDMKNKMDIEFQDEGTLYTSMRIIMTRNIEHKQVIEYVSKSVGIPKVMFHTKYSRKYTEARALLVVLLISLCNFSTVKICSILGNITQANISKLSSKGVELIKSNEKYSMIFRNALAQ